MTDILIRASPDKIEHKFADKVPVGTEYCFWTGVKPRQYPKKVMFTDGINVYAEGEVIDVNEFEGVCFEPLKRVKYPQPKKAPTRGFAYV